MNDEPKHNSINKQPNETEYDPKAPITFMINVLIFSVICFLGILVFLALTDSLFLDEQIHIIGNIAKRAAFMLLAAALIGVVVAYINRNRDKDAVKNDG